MKRRLASALLLASAFTLPIESASALGLGKITLKSTLNEPLDAEVQLHKLGTLNEDQIITRLASNSDFELAGVDRTFFHSQMRFKVEIDRQGSGTLFITSHLPVKEPFLDFLIEARWPKGRLIRGYTVLLDLPHVVRSRTEAKPAAEAVSQTSAPAATGQQSYSSVSSPATGDSYKVQQGDSLWKIAKNNQLEGKSINETMAALYESNPEAFVNGDRNRLKAGAVLRLPGSAASSAPAQPPKASISPSTVPDKPQLEAAEASSAPAPIAEDDKTGHLTLTTSPEDSGSTSASTGDGEADSGAVQELEQQLTENEEELALAEREKQQMQEQLSSMEEEIKTLQELVDLKNNQLAEVQSGSEQPAQVETVVETVVEDKPDGFSQWILNPLTWVTSGIALLALLALAFFRRKPEEEAGPAMAPVSAAAPEAEESFDDVDLDTDFDDQESAELEDEELVTPPADGDAASEADIYIAYGRFDQAAEVLTRALDADPDDENIRLKLAEVYVDGKMKDEYLALLSLAEDSGDSALVIKMKALLDGSPDAESWVEEEVKPLSEDDSLDLDLGKLSTDEDDSYTTKEAVVDDTSEADTEESVEALPEADLPDATDDYSTEDLLPGDAESHSEFEDEAPLLDDFDMDASSEGESSLSDALALTTEEETGATKQSPEGPDGEAVETEAEPEFSDEEEVETKLELASAYIDMGDYDGARDILEEVLEEGNDEQKARAQELLEQVD